MRLFSPTPTRSITAPTANTATDQPDTPPVDPMLRVHILVEAAMAQAKFADADAELIARQLAGELLKINATLSDVRVAVQTLYQGDLAAAEAYLAYLAQQGFPPTPAPVKPQPPEPERTLAAQNQAIAQHGGNNAYGQLPAPEPPNTQANTLSNIAFYGGNLIAELVANSAYSALVFGERRAGTSAILRAIAYDQIAQSGETLLDILDFHNGEWGGLENIRFEDGSQLVTYRTLANRDELDRIRQKLATVAAEVRRRQRAQRGKTLSVSAEPPPYLFLIDGLSEIHGVLPGWSADRRSKETTFSQSASHLRFVLCHGPAVGISCVATARNHDRCLCDATALGETKLLFLGRVSAGHNGGYRAIDRAIEDKDLMPSPHDRSRYREALSLIKQQRYPVVFTPNGIPRLGRLGDFSGYLSEDLLAHYQHALEVSA